MFYEDDPFPYFEILIFTCLYSLLHLLVFYLLPYPGSKKLMKKHSYYEYYGNHVSYVDCLMVLSLYTLNLIKYGFNFCGENNLILQIISIQTIGYFIADTIILEILHINDNIFRAHHILSLIILPLGIKSKFGQTELWFGGMLTELSNPFMLLRVILIRKGITKGKVFYIAQYGFAALWFFCRIIIGIPTAILNFSCKDGPDLIYVLIGLFGFMSSFWTVKILFMLGRELTNTVYQKHAPKWVSMLSSITSKIYKDSKKWKFWFYFSILCIYLLIPYTIRIIAFGKALSTFVNLAEYIKYPTSFIMNLIMGTSN